MGTLFAQICFFAVLPLLMGVWAICLLHEHGLFAFRQMAMRDRRLPGIRMILLAMAAAAVAYGGSKGGGGGPPPVPEDPGEPPPKVEPVEEHDADEGMDVHLISSLPYVIKGKTSTQPVRFRVGMAAVVEPVAIHTCTGTGTVYSAMLNWEDEAVPLSNDAQQIPLVPGIVYTVTVGAVNATADSQYAIRIGKFDPQLVVTFDGNGGDVSPRWKTYQPGKPYGTFPSAVWENHVLTGWSTEATNGIVMSVDTAACVGYTNLFAQWQYVAPTNTTPPVVTNYVSFVANGGVGEMDRQMFIEDEAQALASNLFTRATYDFSGWATSATGEVVYADGAVVSNLSETAGEVALYAQWTRMANVYDVAFQPNGGMGVMESQAFFLNEPQPLATNLFVRSGYDFTGWATSTNGPAV